MQLDFGLFGVVLFHGIRAYKVLVSKIVIRMIAKNGKNKASRTATDRTSA